MPALDPIWISFAGEEPPARRTPDASVMARLPAVLQVLARFALALPRRSRLRQVLLRRSVLQAMGAWVRGDYELALLRYAPDVVLTPPGSLGMRLDFEESYRGRDGVRAFVRTFQAAFSDLSYEPQWLVDLGGNTFVILVHHSLRGRASGVQVEQVTAQRVHLRHGLVVREEVQAATIHDREEMLRAVGLDRTPDPK
jgi:ketosteroid isomerase-like protein